MNIYPFIIILTLSGFLFVTKSGYAVDSETISPSESLIAAELVSTTKKYVSDELVIMLRAGPSSKHRIVRTIPSGYLLEVFEIKDKYSLVKTKNGTQGWVL